MKKEKNKDTYIRLCKEKTIPIFSQYWWLDAVVGRANWDCAICNSNNAVLGAFPYSVQKYAKLFKGIYNPPLVWRTNLYINYQMPNISDRKKMSFDVKVIDDLLQQIPKTDLFFTSFDTKFENWLPFYWNSYKSYNNFTYVIDDLHNLDNVFSNFHKRTIKNINKARENVDILESDDIDAVYKIKYESFRTKNLDLQYSLEKFKELDRACVEKSCRKILLAKQNNRIIGVAYLVWDKNYLYLFKTGVLDEYKQTGVSSLIVWESIKTASKLGKKFDFEGSINKNIEFFFRSFNPVRKNYLTIYKYNNFLLKLYREILLKK